MDDRTGCRASIIVTVLALALTVSFSATAIAQVAPAERPAAPNAAAPNAHDAVTLEDSAILPSTGNEGDTAAPSMALDCQRDPVSCKTPLTQPTEGPALSVPSRDPTDPDAGAPVVATPKD